MAKTKRETLMAFREKRDRGGIFGFGILGELGVLKRSSEQMEKKFYYCDSPLHPHGEIVQILTYERDPKCPLCLKVMTYGRYWR